MMPVLYNEETDNRMLISQLVDYIQDMNDMIDEYWIRRNNLNRDFLCNIFGTAVGVNLGSLMDEFIDRLHAEGV